MIHFTFPQNQYLTIQDKTNLHDRLIKDSTQSRINVQFNVFRIRKYLYAKCRHKNCQAQMRYKKIDDQQCYEIIKFQPNHDHNVLRTEISQIQNFINNLPSTFSIQAAKKLVVDRFKITENRFYYFYKKVKFRNTTFKQLVEYLDSNSYDIRSDFHYEQISQNSTLPSLFIVVSPKMKDNYKKYGRFTGFDFTFNIIQQKHSSGKMWKVGCFMGISCSKKLVPFALVLSIQQTKVKYHQILKNFFQIMGKQPQVIISDQDVSLSAVLKQMKQNDEYQGVHLLDCYHVLKNIRKNIKNKQNIGLFKDLCFHQTEQQFQNKLQFCMQRIDNEEDMMLLKRFVHNSAKYCFSKIPDVFFGFLPNTSMNQKVHDLIKTTLPYSKPFCIAVKKIAQLLDQIGNRCQQYKISNIKAEDFYNSLFLKQVRFSVCESVFERIISQIAKCIHYEVKNGQNQCEIKFQQHKIINKKINQRWICQCSYSIKTGIPCSHLLKVLLMKKVRIINYISQYWMIMNQSPIKKPRPKKTRRNMIK